MSGVVKDYQIWLREVSVNHNDFFVYKSKKSLVLAYDLLIFIESGTKIDKRVEALSYNFIFLFHGESVFFKEKG